RALGGHDVSDHTGKRRSAVVLPRQTDRDAGREEQAEIREDRVARRRDERDVKHVRLAETEQDRSDRQDRDRQHQRPAERLQLFSAQPHSSASATIERTSCADAAAQARVARTRQSSDRTWRTADLMAGTAADATESSVTPSPTRMGAATGSDAKPPH